jgi:hypothetical protein
MASLLDRLTTGVGSALSVGNGVTPSINVGATNLSKLHADNDQPGYSLNGANAVDVRTAYNAYNDGVPNLLPNPSLLDLNGVIPPTYRDTGPIDGHY